MQVSPAHPLSNKKVKNSFLHDMPTKRSKNIFHHDIHKYKQTKQTRYLSKQLRLLLLILLKKKMRLINYYFMRFS